MIHTNVNLHCSTFVLCMAYFMISRISVSSWSLFLCCEAKDKFPFPHCVDNTVFLIQILIQNDLKTQFRTRIKLLSPHHCLQIIVNASLQYVWPFYDEMLGTWVLTRRFVLGISGSGEGSALLGARMHDRNLGYPKGHYLSLANLPSIASKGKYIHLQRYPNISILIMTHFYVL